MAYTWIMNSLNCVFGMFSCFIGLSMMLEKKFLQELLGVSVIYYTAASLLIIVGLLLAAITICGHTLASYGAYKTKFRTLLFVIVKVVMVVFAFIAGILCFVYLISSVETVGGKLEEALDSYKDDEALRAMWEETQTKLKCCGNDGYQDWANKSLPNNITVPVSCCDSMYDCTRAPSEVDTHTHGCYDKIIDYIKRTTLLAAGLAIWDSMLLAVGALLTYQLYFRRCQEEAAASPS